MACSASFLLCSCILVMAPIVLHSQSASTQQETVRSRLTQDWRPRAYSAACTPKDCKLPDCFCAGRVGPRSVETSQVPQMVVLTFDDAINEDVFGSYQRLLGGSGAGPGKRRTNPNGCPIAATFYLSHNWTDYRMVQGLHKAGHEIASHSISHRMPQRWWAEASLSDWEVEVNGQKENIVSLGQVPASLIRGMRVPFLELGGDKQFAMMANTGLLYDSSFMVGPYEEGGVWPFTLDYPPSWRYCSNRNCPKSSFPAIWELPMNRWIGPDGKPCSMVDDCRSQPVDKADALGYMWYNFNRFYRGNRAPFGIHLHAVWFDQDPAYADALETFLDALSGMEDVFVVTASQVIDWMRKPTPLDEIRDFQPWKTTCKPPQSSGPVPRPQDQEDSTQETSTAPTSPEGTGQGYPSVVSQEDSAISPSGQHQSSEVSQVSSNDLPMDQSDESQLTNALLTPESKGQDQTPLFDISTSESETQDTDINQLNTGTNQMGLPSATNVRIGSQQVNSGSWTGLEQYYRVNTTDPELFRSIDAGNTNRVEVPQVQISGYPRGNGDEGSRQSYPRGNGNRVSEPLIEEGEKRQPHVVKEKIKLEIDLIEDTSNNHLDATRSNGRESDQQPPIRKQDRMDKADGRRLSSSGGVRYDGNPQPGNVIRYDERPLSAQAARRNGSPRLAPASTVWNYSLLLVLGLSQYFTTALIKAVSRS